MTRDEYILLIIHDSCEKRCGSKDQCFKQLCPLYEIAQVLTKKSNPFEDFDVNKLPIIQKYENRIRELEEELEDYLVEDEMDLVETSLEKAKAYLEDDDDEDDFDDWTEDEEEFWENLNKEELFNQTYREYEKRKKEKNLFFSSDSEEENFIKLHKELRRIQTRAKKESTIPMVEVKDSLGNKMIIIGNKEIELVLQSRNFKEAFKKIKQYRKDHSW